MLLCIGKTKVSAMDTGRRHPRLFRRDFSRMAFNPYSHGKSYPQEMAQSGISGTTHPLSDGSRYPTGWNYFTRACEYDGAPVRAHRYCRFDATVKGGYSRPHSGVRRGQAHDGWSASRGQRDL